MVTDKPEPYKQYRLIGKPGEPSIAHGNTWAESEVGYHELHGKGLYVDCAVCLREERELELAYEMQFEEE